MSLFTFSCHPPSSRHLPSVAKRELSLAAGLFCLLKFLILVNMSAIISLSPSSQPNDPTLPSVWNLSCTLSSLIGCSLENFDLLCFIYQLHICAPNMSSPIPSKTSSAIFSCPKGSSKGHEVTGTSDLNNFNDNKLHFCSSITNIL